MNKIKIKENFILEIEKIVNLYKDAEWYAYIKDKTKLLNLILEKHKSIRQIVLMTYNTKETIDFYRKNGMVDTAEYNGMIFIKYNSNCIISNKENIKIYC